MTEPDLISKFPVLSKLLLRKKLRKRIPIVRQAMTTDCGAACLSMVLAYHGKRVPLEEIRKGLGVGRDGTTAAALLRLGRAHGLRGRCVRCEISELAFLPTGAVLHWQFRHFLVLERATIRKVYVIDPALGRRPLSIETFRGGFTGVAVIFERAAEFQPCGGEKTGKLKTISDLLGQMFERRDLIVRLLITSALVQILSLALPLMIRILFDRVLPYRDYSLLLTIALGYCAFQTFSLITGFIRSHLLIHIRAQLEVRLTLRFLDHLISLPYSYFQQRTVGDIMLRLGSNNVLRDILTSSVLSTALDVLTASFYFILLLMASSSLTLAVIALAVIRFLALAIARWRQRHFLRESIDNQAKSQTYQVELLSSMETLKAMGIEHQAAERWANVFVDGLNISIRRGRLDAIFGGVMGGIATASTLLMTFYGAYLVLEGKFTLGTMMAFNTLAAGFLTPLGNLFSLGLQVQTAEIYLERLHEVMTTRPEQDNNSVYACGELSGGLTLEKVSFAYGEGRQVVEDITCKIAPGSRIAIVGLTGSGKSTLARLMAGLYDPVSGRILFDGKDLKYLDRRSVRSQLGIVTQEAQLFGCSIRENIAFGDPEMGLERVVQAAKLACIHVEIIAMPMGYETILSDRGLSLSGGQRQRLALARALARRPKILVLDEATSHLDLITEDRVNKNLAALQCTRIVIAHRLSTVRDADVIFVMDAGKIVARGSHEDLLRDGGLYCSLTGNRPIVTGPVAKSV
jgi:ATP-binding cassette, subfamily B, bacterial